MWTPDYYVRLVELPPAIDGTVVPNDDGSFDIYLNSRNPEEKRRIWLEHELEHIRLDHFLILHKGIEKLVLVDLGLVVHIL